MQRISFLRLFYHKPQYAILDEATSSLSLELEELLYDECLKLGITLISVGHRKTLIKYHHFLLNLVGDGQWNIQPITEINKAQNNDSDSISNYNYIN